MKCPHCTTGVNETWSRLGDLGEDPDGRWRVFNMTCPECNRIIIEVRNNTADGVNRILARPRGIARTPLGEAVPDPYADDYREACLVLPDSPKASAALTRRCLQLLLRDIQKVKPRNLNDEIEEAIPKLPSHLGEAIDAIRNIGNFSAHPLKSTNSGEIVEVEPGEAEWSLEVIEGLFDHYFIQPNMLRERRAALDAKLSDAGKPPMK